jgi:predicted transcriptional regulator
LETKLEQLATKADVADLRKELQLVEERLRRAMRLLEQRLLIKPGSLMVVAVGVVVALVKPL